MRHVQRGISTLFLVISILAVTVASAAGYFVFSQNLKEKLASINSFEECAKHYPVMESYPEQCNTPDGKHFTRQLTEEEKKDRIVPPIPPSPSVQSIKITDPKDTFPLLYPAVEWEATESAKVTVWDSEKSAEPQSFDGERVQSIPISNYPGSLADNFELFYEKLLTEAGWKINDSAWADGVDGWQRGYKKENKYINLIYDGINNGPNRKGAVFKIEYVELQ